MDSAKRVILRIQESDVKPDDLFEPVRLYLQKTKHSLDETEDPWNRHFIHLQPPSDIPQKNPKIHVIIDLNKDQYLKAFVDRDFPHECYRIKYINNKMWAVQHFKSMTAQ